MKQGFTLIELLAVIIILAIITLIAVPIVLDLIDNSRNKTNEQNIDLYGRSIEQAVAAYFVKKPRRR